MNRSLYWYIHLRVHGINRSIIKHMWVMTLSLIKYLRLNLKVVVVKTYSETASSLD